MTEAPIPAAILREHLDTCSELHELLLEENRVMRASGAPPSEELLGRKKELLPRLDASLLRLRQVNESQPAFSRADSKLVEEARSRLLQILMLDRENERLLLKAALPPRLKAAFQPAIPGQVARAYRKFASERTDAGPTAPRSD